MYATPRPVPGRLERLRRLRRTSAHSTSTASPLGRRTPRATRWPRLGRRFDTWLEIGFAVVLALSTLASAWCAFESQRWNGVEATLFNEADAARSETVRLNDVANRDFLIDFSLWMEYTSATLDGRATVASQLYQRFPPDLRSATDVWLAGRPFDEDTPWLTPFELPEYQSTAREASQRQAERATELAQQAQIADDRADNFLGLTVIFAVVLFVGGVGSKFEARGLRIASFVFAVALLVAVGGLIVTFTQQSG